MVVLSLRPHYRGLSAIGSPVICTCSRTMHATPGRCAGDRSGGHTLAGEDSGQQGTADIGVRDHEEECQPYLEYIGDRVLPNTSYSLLLAHTAQANDILSRISQCA